MNKNIFRSSLLTVCLVLAATIALIMGLLFHFLKSRYRKSLPMRPAFWHMLLKMREPDILTVLITRITDLPEITVSHGLMKMERYCSTAGQMCPNWIIMPTGMKLKRQ